MNKDLLYSTGKYTPYRVITYKRGCKKRIYICLHITLNHFGVHLKLTQHCESTIVNQLDFNKIKNKNTKKLENQKKYNINFKLIKYILF